MIHPCNRNLWDHDRDSLYLNITGSQIHYQMKKARYRTLCIVCIHFYSFKHRKTYPKGLKGKTNLTTSREGNQGAETEGGGSLSTDNLLYIFNLNK